MVCVANVYQIKANISIRTYEMNDSSKFILTHFFFVFYFFMYGRKKGKKKVQYKYTYKEQHITQLQFVLYMNVKYMYCMCVYVG